VERRARLEVRAFTDDVIDDAARLLAVRHRQQRTAEPGLSPIYEDVAAARTEIETLASKEGASGAVGLRGGQVVGFLVGTPREPSSWGPNMWVEGAGHAVAEPELVRDLYGAAAAIWVEMGATRHHAVVPATDPALVDAWFRSGFGQQHVHAIREAPGPGERFPVPPGLTIRPAERHDVPMLGRLDVALPEHQALSPVFSRMPLPSLDEAVAEYEEGFDDPAFATFVAEHDGRVIGSAVGCAIEESSEHRGIVRPDRAGFLGFAAVLPEARGLGAGRALGEAVLLWARDAGHPTVVTDWRETNLLSSRAWPSLGFRPTFRRLFRAIA
jgi:GNAT superfamily N-acetyltransferase